MISRFLKNASKITVIAIFIIIFGTFVLSLLPKKETKPKEEVKGQISEDVSIGGFIKMQEINFKVYPEKRQPQPSHINNWSTIAKFVMKESNSNNVVLEETITTNNLGEGEITLGPTQNITAGNYDIYIKGYSHLTKKYSNLHLSKIVEFLDFTPYGDLFAGDTHTDDQINSLDISVLLSELNSDDYKNDLNQDQIVNSLDISIQVFNIGKIGDA